MGRICIFQWVNLTRKKSLLIALCDFQRDEYFGPSHRQGWKFPVATLFCFLLLPFFLSWNLTASIFVDDDAFFVSEYWLFLPRSIFAEHHVVLFLILSLSCPPLLVCRISIFYILSLSHSRISSPLFSPTPLIPSLHAYVPPFLLLLSSLYISLSLSIPSPSCPLHPSLILILSLSLEKNRDMRNGGGWNKERGKKRTA